MDVTTEDELPPAKHSTLPKNDDLLLDLNDKPPYDFLASDENEMEMNEIAAEKSKLLDTALENNQDETSEQNSNAKTEKELSSEPMDLQTKEIDSKTKENVDKKDVEKRNLKKDKSSPTEEILKKNLPVNVVEAPLRRSRRSNKGVGKEIFDPSYIPVKRPNEHVRSPSPSPPSSPSLPSTPPKKKENKIATSPKLNKSQTKDTKKVNVKKKVERTVVGQSPRRRSPRVEEEKDKNKEDKEDDIPLKKLQKNNKKEEDVEDYISEEEDEDTSSEDSDDSYNDPGRLWCICQQPHNNRFMISCDDCENWFHGDCVGISLQKGKKMEEENAEYLCPNCIKKQKKFNTNQQPKKSFADKTKKTSQVVKKSVELKSGRNLKGYAHATKHKSENDNKEASLPKKSKTSKEITKTLPDGKRKCIVATCMKEAQQGSIYCSNQCILLHAKQSLKAITKEKEEKREEKRKVDPNEHISVICRRTKNIIRGPTAPRRQELSAFLRANPSYTVFRPSLHKNPASDKSKHLPTSNQKVKSSLDFYKHVASQNRKRDCYGTDPDYDPKDPDAVVEEIVKKSIPPYNSNKIFQQRKINPSELIDKKLKKKISKHEDQPFRRKSIEEKSIKRKSSIDDHPKKVERSLSGSSSKSSENDIRNNIRKSLMDILKMRSSSSDDLKMHSESIIKLSTKIEDSLFKHFGETNTKYKNKYRSIMFNLKDTRNHGLWRKVIIGEVTTSELVQMTAEQMASKKLAEWRKKELTQELDLIKKEEKQKATNRPVSKITHKGEIAIQEDYSDLTDTNIVNRENLGSPTLAPVRKKRTSISEEEVFDFSVLSPDDTTLNHKEHLFHHNCKICTGKVKEEDVDFPEESSKKVKSSTSIILSSEAQLAANVEKTPVAPVSQIKLSNPVRLKKEKAKRRSSDVNSHDASLSPSTFLKDLTAEKKKKIVLPKPPPLSDISQREEISPSSKTPVIAEKKIVKKEKVIPEVKKEIEKVVEKKSSDLIWSGFISMLELSTFKANVYPVSDNCEGLELDLPTRLVLGGRIHPKVVWEYLEKVRLLPTKELSVVRFHAANNDDRVGYIGMLSYFSSRKRFGVVSNQDRMLLKDMYLVPLLESQPVPSQLLNTKGVHFPPNRPSMLLGVIVRHALKETAPPVVVEKKKAKIEEVSKEEEEEYVPDDKPILQDEKVSVPFTEEELGEKKKNPGISLFDRNKSLTPSTRFFMRKNSEEKLKQDEEHTTEDNIPYSPTSHIKDYSPSTNDKNKDEEEEVPYDPAGEEEYDPETAFAPISPQQQENEDNAPYDPEENLLDQSMNVDELVEKQAFLEKMQKELEEKKAKLFEVEKSLQEKLEEKPPAPVRVDPRLARRPPPSDVPDTSSGNPLQTILSALQMPPKTDNSITKSPPQLPDSTTKSDAEEPSSSGLVPYASTPDSNNEDVKKGENVKRRADDEEERMRRNKRQHRSSSVSSSSSHEESGGSRHRRSRRSNSPRRRRDRDYNRHHHHGHHHRRDHERRSWSRDRRR